MNQGISGKRIHSIDILRGLIMIIMALDHVRDYFHNEAMLHDPMDPAFTTYPLYFTRWITHYCAPLFVFLSGMSAYLSGVKKTTAQLSGFLIRRGFWLILIEFTVVTFGWTFNPYYPTLVMQVIWAIGVSMIALGLLVWLPLRVVLGLSLIILLGHNTLDLFEKQQAGNVGFLWDLIHHGHFVFYPFAANHGVLIVYPFLPWIGIMGLGYVFGQWILSRDPAARNRFLLQTGMAFTAGFVLLRLVNSYGDPRPWSSDHPFLFSFLDTAKYPPSLAFTLMTLGPGLLFLAVAERLPERFRRWTTVFGKVPFFFYIAHIYLIHLLCVAWFYGSGYTNADIVNPNIPFWFRPATFGFGLPGVYLVWALVIVLLYQPCRWFGQVKENSGNWLLRYL